jgi:hypothetical protein
MRRERKVVVKGAVEHKSAASRQRDVRQAAPDYSFPDDSMLTVMARAFRHPNDVGAIMNRFLNWQPSR